MSLNLTGPDVDEVTQFIQIVLNAYKNGWTGIEDARGSLAHVMFAAINQNPNFMGEVRGHSKMFLRDA